MKLANPLMLDNERMALTRYAAGVDPAQEIVEIGSWAGGSAAFLADGARGHVTCVDIWTDWIDPPEDQWPATGADALAHFMETVNLSRVTPMKAPSLELVKFWVKPVGMLFIDALHTYKGCRDDFRAWSPFVVPGGVLAIHDYGTEEWWSPGVTQAVDEIPFEDWEHLETVDSLWVARRR